MLNRRNMLTMAGEREKEKAMNHTPGPWKMFEVTDMRNNPRNYTIRKKAEGRGANNVIAFTPDGTTPESQANARLIAAAPDMLAALEFALQTIEHREGLRHRVDLFTESERDKLRVAIAKAKGESE